MQPATPVVPADRQGHGSRLRDELELVERAADRQERPISIEGAVEGVYATFESFPGVRLALESLDPRQGTTHPELMSVHESRAADGSTTERATVFIPRGTIDYFLRRVTSYLETADETSPKNRKLVDPIQSVKTATIAALWTDPPADFPGAGERVWWEVWLRKRDGQEAQRLQAFAAASDLRMGRQSLGFGDRTVTLLEATREQLSVAVDVLDDLAELRRPSRPAQFLTGCDAREQEEWVAELASRLNPAGADAPAVCVVDSGVFREHPLIEGSLSPSDCHAADASWPVHDDRGHGTEMAGLALYDDLGEALASQQQIHLRHRLESAKLLPPPPGENAPDLYGALTAAAASTVEIEAPFRSRVFSLAVTAPTTEDPESRGAAFGQPTAWSATLDALAAGRSVITDDKGLVFLDDGADAARRLFVVSAGNIHRWESDHLTRSDLSPVQDPAQAWNALTVGAYTELDTMVEAPPGFAGWAPVAARGELSPFSRTSVPFSRMWPVKPDVVLEGGNLARSPDGTDFDTPPNLQLLTTSAPLRGNRLLTVTAATSAATAQGAALAAGVQSDYPSLWSEAVRALVVHSAEWTPAMLSRFHGESRKRGRAALLRRYGMGVPSLARAARSAGDALTLITQDVIHPFTSGKMREIHFHNLPWPSDILADLGSTQVRLRVTLSYFIEPNPGRRGWQRRYSYASHGLRFDVRRAAESNADFEKRINQKAVAEEERRPASIGESGEWFFGSDQQRAPGSLHTDIWTGSAADLAQRGALAVFPVTGWWKENPTRDRSDNGARYALVVSIQTPREDVDIWSPVAQQIGVPTEITI